MKTVSGQEVLINRDLVTHLEPSSGWHGDGFASWGMQPTIAGKWMLNGTPIEGTDMVETEITIKNNKTAVWLSGNSTPVIIDSPIINVAKLLDIDADYSMEESIYGE